MIKFLFTAIPIKLRFTAISIHLIPPELIATTIV